MKVKQHDKFIIEIIKRKDKKCKAIKRNVKINIVNERIEFKLMFLFFYPYLTISGKKKTIFLLNFTILQAIFMNIFVHAYAHIFI